MAQHWTARVMLAAREINRVFGREQRQSWPADDADARRMRTELDAIRTRFPDHA